jgi:hypothetical protein
MVRPVCLDAGNAVELGELLEFLSDWVQNNTGAGIFHEISNEAAIRGNTAIDNGSDSPGWVWGGGTHIAGSADVTVADNVVERNRTGIVGIDQQRGSGQFGKYRLRGTRRHQRHRP